MAIYIPPKNQKNERFNVADFDNNLLDYSIYDERYVKLFGSNSILSINKFYGITEFFNNVNSFMYLSILRVLSVANSILSPLFISEKIQTNELEVKIINGIPYNPVGVLLNLNGIQYPILRTINDTTNIYGGLDISTILNNSSIILYPNYSIIFYGNKNVLLYKMENTTDNIIFSNVNFNLNLPCKKIIICYRNKKIFSQ